MKLFENNNIEIYDHAGEGYESTMNFGEWRVAFMNYIDELEKLNKYERHLETDEVFVLLQGKATLVVGEEMEEHKMEKFKIYNVRRGVWHGIVYSKDARVLIVENHNTSDENSEKYFLDPPKEIEL